MTGRIHGSPPFRTVVVHGGPGAPGSALGIARLLDSCLEPFQTEHALHGQIEELARVLMNEAEPPAILIGHSWGAMLSLLVAHRYPALVAKVVLVCSGGFTAASYTKTNETRMSRLSPEDRARAQEISALRREKPDEPLAELTLEYYNLLSKADNYDLDPGAEDGCVGFQNDVNKSVWAEVVALRENGELERIVASVSCPVVAIHGVYDPHPIDEVAGPLSILQDFKLVPLENCGHEPWKERQARDAFRLALLDAVSL